MSAVADLEADLHRREARFARYLAVRGFLSLPLAALGLALLALAVAFALASSGLLGPAASSPLTATLTDWAGGSIDGFNAIGAPFIPATASLICLRAAWGWWQQRKPADPTPACPIC